jgi:hypothetical protein
MKPEKMNITWKLLDMEQRQDDYIMGPPRVKWKWNAYYISTWTKVTQVSDVAHGPLVYCFTSRSRIFHLYGDVTITSEGLQNLGLWTALRAFEQGRIFMVTQGLSFSNLIQRTASFSCLLRHTHKGMWRIYFNLNSHGSKKVKLLYLISQKPCVKIPGILWYICT